MTLRSPVRRVSLLAAAALAAGALVATAPAAHAAPVFDDDDTTLFPTSDAHTNSGPCITTDVVTPQTPIPVVENGAPTTFTSAVSATSADGGDTATLTAVLNGTSSVRSAGANPTSLSFVTTGTATADFALPTSGCTLTAYAQQYFYFGFTVTSPLLLDLSTTAKGSTYSEFYLYDDNSDPYLYVEGYNQDFAGNRTVLLPPSTYYGYAGTYTGVEGVSTDSAKKTSVSVQGTFRAPGSQLQGASGKGTKYVSMPSAVNCAAGTLTPTVTTAKKAAKSVKRVKVYVNDALVKSVKKPGRGAAIAVSVAGDQDAEVTAEVTVQKPKKKGKKAKPAKVYEVSAAYEACTV